MRTEKEYYSFIKNAVKDIKNIIKENNFDTFEDYEDEVFSWCGSGSIYYNDAWTACYYSNNKDYGIENRLIEMSSYNTLNELICACAYWAIYADILKELE